VFEGWSSRRVLTMERLSGRPVSVFAATASAAAKQRAGEALGRNFMRMVYVHRAIHADPHPGNYLFAPDGRVGMIDFGCVRRFDLDWIVNYGTCGFGTRHGDKERVMQAALQIGALTERDADAEDALWALCRAIGVPFRGGPFTLGGENDDSQAQITHAMRRVIPSGRLRAPRELIYLHRGLGGTYAIARQLRPTADWGAIFEAAWGRAVADRHAMRPAGEAVGASPGP
jgi:predicted unusual protein kinase regulating ubiquinone biosynthesis (AarF/ABC1/UbiB family)